MGGDAKAEQGTAAVLRRELWTSALPLKDLSRDTHGWTQPSGASVTQAEAPWVALGWRGAPAAPDAASCRSPGQPLVDVTVTRSCLRNAVAVS